MRRAANEGSGAGDLPPPVRMISAIATTHDDINHPRGNKKSPQVNDEDTK